jgi:hypothetical protein
VIGHLTLPGVSGKIIGAWHKRRYKRGMRTFLALLAFAGFGVLYLYQKQHEPAVAPGSTTTVSAKATPAPQLTPAPRGQASEYNYMKRALDRASTVRDQSRDQTRAAQNP